MVADGATAAPYAFNQVQPDGTPVTLTLQGDEWNNWLQDTNGYSVVEQREGGKRRFVYAGGLYSNGTFIPTGYQVGKEKPEKLGLPKGLRKRGRNDTDSNVSRNSRLRRRHEALRMRRLASTGTLKNLVVMVRFADHATRTLPDTASLNTLFNNVGPNSLCPTGSVRDVWFKNSYGRLTITSVLTGWITVSQTEVYSAAGQRY